MCYYLGYMQTEARKHQCIHRQILSPRTFCLDIFIIIENQHDDNSFIKRKATNCCFAETMFTI